jgi:hypothetical protein
VTIAAKPRSASAHHLIDEIETQRKAITPATKKEYR